MKFAGLLVLPAGFFLSLAALILFPDPNLRAVFLLSGVVVELIGLGVAIRGHQQASREARR